MDTEQGASANLVREAGAELYYRPDFIDSAYAAAIDSQTPWTRESIVMFGNLVPVPRQVAFYADPGITYRYSGVSHQGLAFTEVLTELRRLVSEHCGVAFNSVLLNRYANGQDYMGYHSDNEPELGPAPTVASLSLGATRRFLVKARSGQERLKIDLASGSLVVMTGWFQQAYLHAIGKTKRETGVRINLSFRQIVL